jgi:hypothetical protein
MYIVFGDQVKAIADSFTLLELDTFKLMPDQRLVPTWCVLEKVALEDFPILESRKKIHSDLIEQYRKQNWEFCHRAIAALLGSWNKELDSFYVELGQRINELTQNPPGPDWDGTLVRHVDPVSATSQ